MDEVVKVGEVKVKVEKPNILVKAISKVEARTIFAFTFLVGILWALAHGFITADQFMALIATDGLLYKVLERK